MRYKFTMKLSTSSNWYQNYIRYRYRGKDTWNAERKSDNVHPSWKLSYYAIWHYDVRRIYKLNETASGRLTPLQPPRISSLILGRWFPPILRISKRVKCVLWITKPPWSPRERYPVASTCPKPVGEQLGKDFPKTEANRQAASNPQLRGTAEADEADSKPCDGPTLWL